MSYSIDSSKYLSGKLYISKFNVEKLLKRYKDDLPEGNFFDDLGDIDTDETPDPLPIKIFWWYGSGSSCSYDGVLFEVLKHTTGEAEILFVWEGGDSQTGIYVKDGVVEKRKVKMTLVKE